MTSTRLLRNLARIKKPFVSLTRQTNPIFSRRISSKENAHFCHTDVNPFKTNYKYSSKNSFRPITSLLPITALGTAVAIITEKKQRKEERGPDTEIIDENAKLNEYPTEKEFPFDNNCQLTIGDLHGNALKLIYFLVRQNVLDLKREDYNKIVEIYNKDIDALTQQDIIQFKTILENTRFHPIPKGALIRLIGDELADRGSNDYFVLLIFKKMATANLPFEILFSNHGFEFINVYEKGLLNNKSYLEKYEGGFAQSLTNLRKLVEKDIISLSEVDEMVNNYYLPNLKLLSFSLQTTPNYLWNLYHFSINDYEFIPPDISRGFMTVYTHAPVGINTIKAISAREGIQISYADDTLDELANSIKQTNVKFSNIATDKKIGTTFGVEIQTKSKVDDIPLELPVQRIIWSRGHQDKDIPVHTLNGFHLFWAHGHDQNGQVNPKYRSYVTNLDNDFGKSKTKDAEGCRYSILRTHATQ